MNALEQATADLDAIGEVVRKLDLTPPIDPVNDSASVSLSECRDYVIRIQAQEKDGTVTSLGPIHVTLKPDEPFTLTLKLKP